MTYFTFAAMLLLAAGAVFSLYRQLQVLQQNSYLLSRYFKWASGSYTVELAISAIVYCATMFCVLNNKDLFALVLSILFLVARIVLNVLAHKKAIEKLAFTARIKRLYITAIVLLGVLVFVSAISFGNVTKLVHIGDNYLVYNNMTGEILRTICILLSSVTPALTVVIWFITYPIEKAVKKWIVNDSKCVSNIGDTDVESAIDSQISTEQQFESKININDSRLVDEDDSKGAKL